MLRIGKSTQNRRARASRLALVLCFALAHFPFSAVAEDYRVSGIGNKYSGEGWEGFAGFGDEADAARNRTGDRVGDAEKDGQRAQNNARDMNNMGNQIGEDRNKLLPQVQQARAQDQAAQQSGTGSSRLQKLFSEPYNPPKYKDAFHKLGLDNKGKLYHKGPEIQQQLYERAEKLNDYAQQQFTQASQGRTAMGKLQGFQQIAQARNAGMGSLGGQGGKLDPLSGGRGIGGLSSASAGSGAERFKGKGEGGGSGLSDRSAAGATSNGSSQGVSRQGFAAGRGSALAAGKKEGPGEKEVSDKESLARLDRLGGEVNRPSSAIYPSGSLPPGALGVVAGATLAANGPGRAPASSNDSMETLRAVLDISEPEAAPSAQPSPHAVPAPLQATGITLEEDSLFLRVRQFHARAEREGRVTAGR